MGKFKVCIDSGHCKATPGKRAFDSSFFEYEFNFDVSKRIEAILKNHDVDVYVQYVENKNPKIELATRIQNINREKPDLVISIHSNAFGNTWNNANGWEIYAYAPQKADDKSTMLASCIQKHSIPFLGLKDRGIKPAEKVSGIVMNTTPVAVLVEHGFYTNEEELKKLKNSDFRQKCAIADSKGILEFLGIEWKGELSMGNKEHWAKKHLDSLAKKGLIKNPEVHNNLDEKISKGELFALLDRITDRN